MAVSRDRSRWSGIHRYHCKALAVAAPLLNCLGSKGGDILLALREGRFLDVVSAGVDPNSYQDADLFWRDWLAVNLLRKYPKFHLELNTLEEGLSAFLRSELHCADVNRRLSRPFDTPSTGVTGASIISMAAQKIKTLLGDFSWDDAMRFCAFSSGASTRLRRRKGDAFYKFSGKPEVTPNAMMLAGSAILSIPAWANHLRDQYGANPRDWMKLVPGNHVTTVPKNAKTDRTIAIEPDLNMFLQKGIGGLIRTQLKRHTGVDLDSQVKNQELARLGSLNDDLATLDLAAASDSVSIELCRLLLPPSWFEAVMATRSEMGSVLDLNGTPTKWFRYEKISSMGNGYTFELESLIFWALSRVCCELFSSDHRLAIYGDDIIVNRDCAYQLEAILQYVGFNVNVEKSFFAGPFRESCGKHYFRGVDVTPFYIDAEIDDDMRLFWYANSIRRWAGRPVPGFADPRFLPAHKAVLRQLPSHLRKPVIPDGVGDGGLIGCFDEVQPRRRKQRPWLCPVDQARAWFASPQYAADQTWVCPIFVDKTERRDLDDTPAMIRALMYGRESRAVSLPDVLTFIALNQATGEPLQGKWDRIKRGSSMEYVMLPESKRRKYKKSNLYTSQWVDPPVWAG